MGLGRGGEGGSRVLTYTWYEMIRAGHPGHPDTGPESGVVRQPWSGVDWSDAR